MYVCTTWWEPMMLWSSVIFTIWIKLWRLIYTQGVYLEKNWQGGSAYFFGSVIFYILIFWGLEKSLLFCLGLKTFHLFFWGNNFDKIYFFWCPIEQSWFAKPLTEIQSNFGKQIIDQQLARKNGSCANVTYAKSTYFFGSVIFMNLFFLGLIFPGIYFLGIPKNAWAKPPCHVHVRVHSLEIYIWKQKFFLFCYNTWLFSCFRWTYFLSQTNIAWFVIHLLILFT